MSGSLMFFKVFHLLELVMECYRFAMRYTFSYIFSQIEQYSSWLICFCYALENGYIPNLWDTALVWVGHREYIQMNKARVRESRCTNEVVKGSCSNCFLVFFLGIVYLQIG